MNQAKWGPILGRERGNGRGTVRHNDKGSPNHNNTSQIDFKKQSKQIYAMLQMQVHLHGKYVAKFITCASQLVTFFSKRVFFCYCHDASDTSHPEVHW